jgi:hypothetical protein
LKRNSLFFAAGLALTAGSATLAGQSNGTFRATEPPRSRQAVERRPPPVVVVQPTYYQPGYYPGVVYPVAYTTIPAVLMSDGSIWANFGNGYEPVSRACVAQTTVTSNAPLVVAGNGLVLSGGSTSTTTYMPPAPAQQTQSYYNLPSVANQRSAAAQSACYSRDANGQFFVVR